MALRTRQPSPPQFESWIPLARQVVRTSLRLGWKDVFTIYTYPATIPLAEALALEARRAGSDTHLTLMTDDLWFTSMHELSAKWLSAASPIEHALAETETAHIYLGGPADARRMRDIPPEKFEANSLGGDRQHEPRKKRRGGGTGLPRGGRPSGIGERRGSRHGPHCVRRTSDRPPMVPDPIREDHRIGSCQARRAPASNAAAVEVTAGTSRPRHDRAERGGGNRACWTTAS